MITTSLHPCSIEAHPSGNGKFACGLYELDESNEEKNKNGSIIFYQQDGTKLSQLDTQQNGILDMKWDVSGDYLACVTSSSSLKLFGLRNDIDSFKEVSSFTDIKEGMFLSVDWNQTKSSLLQETQYPVSSQLVVSTQAGNIRLLDVNACGNISAVASFTGHAIGGTPVPAWIAAFDPHSKTSMISGGDDLTLRLWDIRSGSYIVNNRSHEAGVTSAQWHPRDEHIFATGSYDENVRFFDKRNIKNPISSSSTGGGIWRVKWHCIGEGSGTSLLVCACMHAGVRVLRLGENREFQRVQEIGRREGQSPQHLLYGVDVVGIDPEGSSLTIASSSFYENKIEIWKCPL